MTAGAPERGAGGLRRASPTAARRLIALITLAVTGYAAAGDEFSFPKLRPATAYLSPDPVYEVVGVEEQDGSPRIWVVASPDLVLTQPGVNRIIRSIQRHFAHELGPLSAWEIRFYSSVRDKPQYPAFRLTDELAMYVYRDNKTYFLTGKQTYGGWAHGPVH